MMAKQRPLLLLLLLMLMTATLKFTGSFCGAEEPTRRYDYAYRIDDFAASVAADRANIASTASCDVPDKREEPQFVRLNKSGRNSSLIVSVTNFIAELELVDTDNRLKEIRRQQTLRIGPQYDLAGCELPYVCTKSPETMKRSEKNKTECVNAMERRVCRDDHSMIMATSFDQPRKVDLLVSCGVMRTCAFRKLSDFSQRYVDPGDENPDRYVCENSQKLVKKDDKKVGSADEDDENEEGDEGGGGSRMLVRRSTPEEVEQPQLIEPELFDETRFMMSPDVHSIEDWEYMWVGENGRGVRTYRTDADGPYQLVDDAITYMNLGVNTVLKIFVDDVYQYVVYTSDQNATHVYRVCLRSLHGYLKLDGLDGQKAGRSSLNDVTLSCPAVDGEHSGGAFDAHYVDGRIILFYQLYNGEIAVCQHDLIGLNDYIVEGRHRCAQQDTDDLLLYGRASCEGFKDIWVDCGPSFEGRISRFAYQATFPFSQIEPLPSIRSSRIAVPNGEMATSFQTFVFKQKLYTFVGTDSGNAFKFILDGARATLAEKVIISDEAVTQITSVNAARADTTGEAEVIVALTKTRVSTFKAESCESLYSDCQSCMKSRDPFCGWCIYQARCTTVKKCENSHSSKYWISTSNNLARCPSFAASPQHFASDLPHAAVASFSGVTLSLNESFSLRVDLHDFNEDFNMTVKSNGDIEFTVPAISTHLIADGADHSVASLTLLLGARPISKSNIIIFDCSKTRQAYPTTACSSCLSQKWECFWCEAINSCSNKRCSSQDFNVQQCPSAHSIISPTAILSQEAERFEIAAYNLNKDAAYSCVVDSCTGETFSAPATLVERNNKNFSVFCNATAKQLSCNQYRESSVSILLTLGDKYVDHRKNLTVTVYNCAIDSSLCGECISLHSKFDACIWCNSTSSCSSRALCHAATVSGMNQCQLPQITSISPTSGPQQGGTILSIVGTNIASSFDEIEAILIENTHCIPLKQTYITARSVMCYVMESSNLVESSLSLQTTYNISVKSKQRFSFKNVNVKVFPRTMVINGSSIKVEGRNLDVGNVIRLVLRQHQLLKSETECTNREYGWFTCHLPDMQQGDYSADVELDNYRVVLARNFSYERKPEVETKQEIKAFDGGGGRSQFKVLAPPALLKWMKIQLIVGQQTMDCYPTASQAKQDSGTIECPIPPKPDARKRDSPTSQSNLTAAQVVVKKRSNLQAYVIFNEQRGDQRYVGDVMYKPNPTFKKIDSLSCPNSDNGTVYISAHQFDSTGLNASDYKVFFTPANQKDGVSEKEDPLKTGDRVACEPFLIQSDSIFCRVHSSETQKLRNTMIKITAVSGDLRIVSADAVKYCESSSQLTIIVVICVICALCVFAAVVLGFKYKSASKKKRFERKMMLTKLDDLENATRETARTEYYQLQTGYMDDFAENISHKINYRSATIYFAQVFFNKSSNIPVLNNLQMTELEKKQVFRFMKLLKNEEFLVFFITTLEEQKNFNVLQKGELASLLAVSLYEDLPYFTRVMLRLLTDLIKSQASKNPKLLLRRSASVVEKMVSHWLSITLYDEYIYMQSGKPLFLLTKAIHYLVNLAPWDVTADKAMNSLNEMTLLGHKLNFTTLELNASVQGSETGETTTSSRPIKVLDLDTITQAKEKIIEGLFRDLAYTDRPKPSELELVLLCKSEEGIKTKKVLNDIDESSVESGACSKINTLLHYKVKSEDTVLLRPNPGSSVISIRTEDEGAALLPKKRKLYHLITPEELVSSEENHTEQMMNRTINVQEMFLTRMVKAKSTVHTYVNDVMQSILKPTKIPKAVCYFFKYLDSEAVRNKINDPDVLHIWKNNSLLLRYWVNTLKNPEFVFDIEKTTIVDSCLNVITQAFMDACTVTSIKLNKDAPSNKLLYAKDVKEYKKWVKEFYDLVSSKDTIPDNEMEKCLLALPKKFKVEFNQSAAVQQMLNMLRKYSKEIRAEMEVHESHVINTITLKQVEAIMRDEEEEKKEAATNNNMTAASMESIV